MGKFFGCVSHDEAHGAFVPWSSVNEWKSLEKHTVKAADFATLNGPDSNTEQSPRVHIYWWCKLENNISKADCELPGGTDLDRMRGVDFKLGALFLREQFASARKLWHYPKEDRDIWASRKNRVAIHIRRGDIRGKHDGHRAVAASKYAHLMKEYLKEVDCRETGVALIAETSREDPELDPLMKLAGYCPGLQLTHFLGEPEIEMQAANLRAARDLSVMGNATVLFMAPSYFSVLGAFLQEPSALRVIPMNWEFRPSKRVLRRWGWQYKFYRAGGLQR